MTTVIMLHIGLPVASCPLHDAVVLVASNQASVRRAATSSQTGQNEARWHKLAPWTGVSETRGVVSAMHSLGRMHRQAVWVAPERAENAGIKGLHM